MKTTCHTLANQIESLEAMEQNENDAQTDIVRGNYNSQVSEVQKGEGTQFQGEQINIKPKQ